VFRKETSGGNRSLIAWAGWQINVPESWRPLKIQGDPAKGTMMIGDAEQPIMLVQWWRPRRSVFKVEKWFEQRFRKLGAVPTQGAPAPERFSKTAWEPELATREGTSKTIWSGYSTEAGLLVEVIVTSLTEERLRKSIFKTIVPGMVVTGEDEPCCWSMYNVKFMSPPGYELKMKHLYSGDVALQFVRGRTSTLLMRQVYPAKLATSRRSLERWLEASPFTERRTLRSPVKETWHRNEPRKLEGIRLTGWKRLPAPLGRCAARHCQALAVIDKEMDRVLIAELQSQKDTGGREADWVIEKMNCVLEKSQSE